MPSVEEAQINLSSLKRLDAEINEIVDFATQVTLYKYSSQTQKWKKTETEGALFIYAHRNPHERGIIILNRLSPNNYVQPLNSEIEFKIKLPFLIYKCKGDIYGTWFYVADECARIGNLCTKMVQYLRKRGKHSTENNAETSQLQSLFEPLRLQANSSPRKGPDILGSQKKPSQNADSKKSKQPFQPATNGRSNLNTINSKGQNGSNRKSTDYSGVPVVHKPVPTRALPSSVEQLFSSVEKLELTQVTHQEIAPMKANGEISLEHLLGLTKKSPLPKVPQVSMQTPIKSSQPFEGTPLTERNGQINDCMASILNKLNESAQKIAKEAELPRNSPTEESILKGLMQASETVPEKKLTLITPEMLEESLSQGPPSPPGVLSRTELKSTLVHLLETDDEFLSKIHNAYVQGARRALL